MRDFEPLVSCVIPIYNAEKYLERGVASLLSQTYKNLEIILVDDCSTDGSWALCKSFSKQYANVRAYQNPSNTGGPLRGRAAGINKSKGDWITFMDGDDYVKPTYIEHLIEATHHGKYDIAVTGHSRLYEDGRIEDFTWQSYSQTTEDRLATFYKHFLEHDFWTDPTDTVGQNLIRADICKKADLERYSNTVYAEDTLMALLFLAHSKHGVNFIDNHDFIWRQVAGSGSHGGFSDKANKQEFYNACFNIFHKPAIYNQAGINLPLVSVIVPVYNVEKYLLECLSSVTDQSYPNLEIVIVDDGSTDSSPALIASYQDKNHQIKTIKQSNLGLNMARAMGSNAAEGAYVTYVDSDDLIHRDYVRTLYENLIWNNVDISVCGLQVFTDKVAKHTANAAPAQTQLFTSRQDSLRYYLNDVPSVPHVHQMTAWGKLYKKDSIQRTDWSLSNYRRHEDNLETLQWYSMAEKGIFVTSLQLYCYRKNPESITQKLTDNVAPDGRSLNYFEFIDELYQKTREYIHDESLEPAIINNFAQTNRIQLQNFFDSDQLDKVNLQAATKNWESIIGHYNQLIESGPLSSNDNMINEIYSSTSWRITKPLRSFKRLLQKLK